MPTVKASVFNTVSTEVANPRALLGVALGLSDVIEPHTLLSTFYANDGEGTVGTSQGSIVNLVNLERRSGHGFRTSSGLAVLPINHSPP